MKPLKQGVATGVETFADVLNVAVINPKEAGGNQELGNGTLYMKLLKTMTEQLLSQYTRRVCEKKKAEGVETLHE